MPTTKKQAARSTNFARYCGGDLLEFDSAEEFADWIAMGVEYAATCDGMPTCSIQIDARCAAVLLERNNRNRTFSRGNATRLKVELQNDTFVHSSDPIVIGADGSMLSGQHRMAALLDMPRKVAKFQITFGMDHEAAVAGIDRGRARSPDQVLRYSTEIKCSAAVLRAIYFAPEVHERTLITSEFQELAEVMTPLASYVSEMFANVPRKLAKAPVMACFARALQANSDAELQRAVDLLQRGAVGGDAKFGYERNMFVLREAILEGGDQGSADARRVLYLKTQAVLKAYLEHRVIKNIRMRSEEDAFPLIGEIARIKAKWDAQYANGALSAQAMRFVEQNRNARAAVGQ